MRRFRLVGVLLVVAAIAATLALAFAPVEKAAYADSGVTVGNVRVSKVTSTNAFLEATAYKSSGVNVYSCGIYLGTSEAGMTKRNTEIVPDVSNAYHGGNDFDIWYDLNDELHITLEPDTTYYFKFYCTVEGNEYTSDVNSFTTSPETGGSSAKVHVEKQETVREEVHEALAQFRGTDSVVKPNDVESFLDTAYETLSTSDTDEILSIGKNESCVWADFKDGSVLLCAPAVEGLSSMPVDSVCSIETFEPCNDTFKNSMEYIRMTDEAADCLSSISSYWHRDVVKENGQVSIDELKDLGLRGGNEIILWRGHGCYVDGRGPVLCIGEYYDANRRTYDKAYDAQFNDKCFMYCDDGRLVITPKFVETYVHDLDGALVYLGACESGRDATMADAWRKAGAKTVIGFSDTVLTVYDGVMTRDFVRALCSKDAKGHYKSAEEALGEAKAANGESDAVRYKGKGAVPKLFGDGGFCFDESLDDVYSVYLEKVQEYQARYGEHQVKHLRIEGEEMDAVTGLGLVDIIDFDADGTDELVLGYSDESKLGSFDTLFDAFTLEVWGYESGNAKRLYTVGPHKGDGASFEVADAIMFDIIKAKGADKPSYIRCVSGDTITYSMLKGGAFTAADTLRVSWSGNSAVFYVNGSKVSESEFDEACGRYSTDDYDLDTVIMGDFLWNGEPYDFEYEVFMETDNAIGRLMIGTTDAAIDDYLDNNGWNEKSDRKQ